MTWIPDCTPSFDRLYIPETGRVLIDGMDLAMIDTVWLRRQIGVVPRAC